MSLGWRQKIFLSRLRHSAKILFYAPAVFTNWPYFVLSRFSGVNGTLLLRNGLKFRIRPKTSDRSTVSEMFILHPYINRALGYQIHPGDVVMDVGANIGAFTLLAARESKQLQIYALEPSGEIFQILQENVRLNGYDNIHIFNLAMDATDGTREFNIDGSSSSFHWKRGKGRSQTVKTISMKSFLDQNHLSHVNFLKMDCEGAEFDVLLNAAPDELNRIHRIALEFHNLSPEKNVRLIRAALETAGFVIDLCVGEWNGLLLARNERFNAATLVTNTYRIHS